MKNHSLKLPFVFDEKLLLHDLMICRRQAWELHFNKADYSGTWESIALRSISGGVHDINVYSSTDEYIDTPLLGECRYFREIIDVFQCRVEGARLLSLSPSSFIKEHCDFKQGYEYDNARIHIPIQTSSNVLFMVSGANIPMLVGDCWYANFSLPHSVYNHGELNRVHLIIDIKRNKWTDQIFEQAGYNFEYERPLRTLSKETQLLIYENLLLQNPLLAADFLAKLDSPPEY
jgi:hypothetical protein